jgi:NOL1/NOP2/fmu family ribosome biogenesis protein
MTEAKKPTPTQRVKELEAEVKRLEDAIMKLNQHMGLELAKYGNEQYSLGDAEGYARGRKEMEAAFAAQSVIQRWKFKA